MFTDRADWMFMMNAISSTVVFKGGVAHLASVLIEGCAVWISGVDGLVSARA